jgi:hypothetical protein
MINHNVAAGKLTDAVRIESLGYNSPLDASYANNSNNHVNKSVVLQISGWIPPQTFNLTHQSIISALGTSTTSGSADWEISAPVFIGPTFGLEAYIEIKNLRTGYISGGYFLGGGKPQFTLISVGRG